MDFHKHLGNSSNLNQRFIRSITNSLQFVAVCRTQFIYYHEVDIDFNAV